MIDHNNGSPAMISLFKPAPVILFLVSILFFCAVSFFLHPREGEFRASILTMGLGYTAKALCSCLYVSEQPEDSCRAFADIEQVSPKFIVDRERKVVTSKFLFFSASASYLGPEVGCVLD